MARRGLHPRYLGFDSCIVEQLCRALRCRSSLLRFLVVPRPSWGAWYLHGVSRIVGLLRRALRCPGRGGPVVWELPRRRSELRAGVLAGGGTCWTEPALFEFGWCLGRTRQKDAVLVVCTPERSAPSFTKKTESRCAEATVVRSCSLVASLVTVLHMCTTRFGTSHLRTHARFVKACFCAICFVSITVGKHKSCLPQ